MRKSVAPVNLIGKGASEFLTNIFTRYSVAFDIRLNLYASVVSPVRGSIVPATFIGKEPAESTVFLCDVDICKEYFANVVPAGGHGMFQGDW